MQVVWRDLEFGPRVVLRSSLSGPQLELAPQGIDVLLLIVHAGKLHEVIAHSRVRSVGPDHEIEADFNLPEAAVWRGDLVSCFKPGTAGIEVGSRQLVVEEELDVGYGVEDI